MQKLLTSFTLVVLLTFSQTSLAKLEAIGRVLIATQGVTAQQPQGEVRQLARKAEIYLGDTLTTPAGGKAQIRLNDGELISLTPSTQLVLEDFSFNPQSEDNTSVKNLVTGGLRSISGVVKGDGYQVKTRAGTIGIRGTAYEAYTQRGTNLFVRMQRGDVNVSNSQGEVTVGVNQPLAAARITSPNAKPEAVSFSALPKFFNQSFNAEATLGLAEEDTGEAATTASNEEASQQEAAQLEETALAEADTTTNQVELTSAEPAGTTTNTEAVPLTTAPLLAANLDAIEQDNARQAANDAISGNNQGGKGSASNIEYGFVGFVLIEDIELINATPSLEISSRNEFEGYLYNNIDINQNNNFSFNLEGARQLFDDESVRGDLRSLDYAINEHIEDPNELFIELPVDTGSLYTNQTFSIYTTYNLDDAEIYYGYEVLVTEIDTFNVYGKFSSFAFSNKAIALADLDKLSIPTNETYTYTLISPEQPPFEIVGPIRGLHASSNLKVNFATKNITANLNTLDFDLEINQEFSGSGNFADFYSKGINLEHQPPQGGDLETGKIAGQFVGKTASGAITVYELGEFDTQQRGIAVFAR